MDAFLDWDNEQIAIVADNAYGSIKIRQQIADDGALAVIPSKSNARKPIAHDKNLWAKRIIVERFFCKMKDMRRLATRFEKPPETSAQCYISSQSRVGAIESSPYYTFTPPPRTVCLRH